MMASNVAVRLGLIGCGEVTRAKHLPALAVVPGMSVVAVCDLDQGLREEVAGRFRVPRCCQDLDELLSVPGLEAVGVCLPPEAHAGVATAVLRAGKHVWIDKPLALGPDDCLGLIEEARRADVIAMTGFHMRFHRLVRQARRIIRTGGLGPVESIRAVWHGPRGDVGLPKWRKHRKSGGGSLVEIAVHHLDLLRFLFDDEIADIFARGRDGVRDDECAVVSARMASGALVSAEFSERTSHEIEIVVSGRDSLLRVDCLRFDGLERRGVREVPGSPKLRLRQGARFLLGLPEGLGVMRRGGDYRDSYRLGWDHFARCIRSGRQPEATLLDGLRATQAVCTALDSRTTGVAVALPRRAFEPVHMSSDIVFSVVIPTYNRLEHLPGLLAALAAQDFPCERFEVILVDDGGSKPIEPVVAPFRDKLRLILVIQPNCGIAAARQKGVDCARGFYLAFTDDDCRPDTGWLSQLAKTMGRHPGCAVGGPTLNNLDDSLLSETTQIVVGSLSEWGRDRSGFVRYSPTSNLAFPASDFLAMGGLNRSWHLNAGEDRDLCARWLQFGFKLLFDPAVMVSHYHALTTRQFLEQHFRYGRGAFLFHRRRSDGAREGRAFERPGFYLRLLVAPFRGNRRGRAVQLAVLVLAAQLATGAGFLCQALGRPQDVPGTP